LFAHLLIFALYVASATVVARAEAPATQPSGEITGRVTAPGEVPLSEMVVYLEATDPAQHVAPPSESVKVSQRGAKFSPALVIVTVGQTVDFLNDEEGSTEHNVFSDASPKQFDLGMYPPGQARSVTFDKPGAVMLYCSIHRYMHGAVFVSPTPYTSRVDEHGAFRIAGVPPGKWILRTWQLRRRFKEVTRPVTVDAGKPIQLDLELRR
jgi:plastocyanin